MFESSKDGMDLDNVAANVRLAVTSERVVRCLSELAGGLPDLLDLPDLPEPLRPVLERVLTKSGGNPPASDLRLLKPLIDATDPELMPRVEAAGAAFSAFAATGPAFPVAPKEPWPEDVYPEAIQAAQNALVAGRALGGTRLACRHRPHRKRSATGPGLMRRLGVGRTGLPSRSCLVGAGPSSSGPRPKTEAAGRRSRSAHTWGSL